MITRRDSWRFGHRVVLLVAALSATAMVAGCSTTDEEPPADAVLTLSHPFGRAFDTEAEVTVVLRGHDVTYERETNTIIQVSRFPILALPTMLDLELPDDPHLMIEQGLVEVSLEDARFYFSIYIDIDGDKQICPGDYTQDYLRSDLVRYNSVLPSEMEVFVEERAAGLGCLDPLAS